MELKIYKGENLINSIDDSKAIYSYIQNLKINSEFYYNCTNNDCVLSFGDTILKFRNVSSEKIILKILSEKILKAICSNDKPNAMQINTGKNLYNVCHIKKETKEFLNVTLSVDESGKLTDISKKMLSTIIAQEFGYWKQTFSSIKNESGMNIYYDDRKLIVDEIIFENIKSDVDKMEKLYDELLDDNPFRRMIK